MAEPRDLRAQQYAFAAHLRDPDAHPPPPGIEERRMAVYRRLFLNNIAQLLGNGFPVVRRILGADAWMALVRRFHALPRSRTPLFPEIGREFVRFVQEHADAGDPPWLAELAHYEWIELAVRIDDSPTPPHVADGDLLREVPVLAPWMRALAYAWPVHELGPGHLPAQPPPGPTLLLVRRARDGQARSARLSAPAYRLLELLGEGRRSGGECLRVLAAEAGAADDPGFLDQGAGLLARMRAEGTVLGTRPRA
ncbi:DNA-binding domain-containing protein [Pseudoxanthomonas suwonensis]|uniref:HvfC family RiPP maturation protein n=1 Tax=Pseudoxanthomonas suwonensis TaxID=314722 RepID=UPI00138F448E|nr:putative DNA-binding domain-containing protein [Pseudoxanthomonas suwonensis]KAF1701828.1 DUF2063 domain-containing protein [Pseudoxanthomonas suwonensis]